MQGDMPLGPRLLDLATADARLQYAHNIEATTLSSFLRGNDGATF
jgi:hypothetical protein